jgi:large subunit ribosomal protein L10
MLPEEEHLIGISQLAEGKTGVQRALPFAKEFLMAFGKRTGGHFLYAYLPRKGGTLHMPTQAKAEIIDALAEKLGRASVTILVQTQGLKVKDMNELRSKMRAAQIDFQIAKNTLLRIASERNNMTELDKSIFNGQTAVAIGYDDEIAAAKAVSDYVRTSKIVVLKSGILGGRTLTADQVESLARMPGGKNYAKAQVVGVIQGPLATTYSLLSAPLRDLCYVIQARAEQLQGGATPAEQPAQ